ncbi:MAG: methyltransferase [Flavisolibacter sp.]
MPMVPDTFQNSDKDEVQSGILLTQLLLGPLVQRCIFIAAELRISDFLAREPLSAQDIALKTKTHMPSLYRMLRLLDGAGFYKENDEKQFELRAMGHVLRTDAKNSLRDYVIFIGSEWVWNVWGQGKFSIKSGGTAQQKTHGKEIFDFLGENGELYDLFNRGLASATLRAAEPIIKAYDFSKSENIIDVGGGNGILLARILKLHSNLKGKLFDQQAVIDKAAITFKNEGVSENVTLVSGNFFDIIPADADLYLLKYILHDWDDKSSIAILKNIAAAMNKKSKLLIVETILPETNQSNIGFLRDIHMLFLVGGKERTKLEYDGLVKKSGLQITKFFLTESAVSLIEVVLASTE